jgi:hypothetical protein
MKGMFRFKSAMREEMERRAIYGSEVFVGKFKKAYELGEMIKPIGGFIRVKSNAGRE